MHPVYSFRDHSALIKGMQQAEAYAPMWKHPFGLPGTESWWSAIDAGDLAVETAEGVVVSYKPCGGTGRPALFTLSDGSTWIAYGEHGREIVYREGQQVRVRFLALQPRKRWAKEHKLIMEIERDDDA